MHGGQLAAKALKAAGVECVFTLSGGHVMAIYDGCLDEGIKVVDVRHEQAAVHAADAWARLHPGKIGVAILTAGPGVTDGVTGVANAWRANSPILVFGGQGPFNNLRRGSLQEMDHVVAHAADHQVGRRLLRDPPHRRVHRAGDAHRALGHPRARPSSRSRWTCSRPRCPRARDRAAVPRLPGRSTPRPAPTCEVAVDLLARAPRTRWSWPAPRSSGRRARPRCRRFVEETAHALLHATAWAAARCAMDHAPVLQPHAARWRWPRPTSSCSPARCSTSA